MKTTTNNLTPENISTTSIHHSSFRSEAVALWVACQAKIPGLSTILSSTLLSQIVTLNRGLPTELSAQLNTSPVRKSPKVSHWEALST